MSRFFIKWNKLSAEKLFHPWCTKDNVISWISFPKIQKNSIFSHFFSVFFLIFCYNKKYRKAGEVTLNVNLLYDFKTLAEVEHYTKAAEKLNISQPTLSHSSAAMEKELGAFLFEKQGRNVVLTKYGRIYMFYVENALTQLELGKTRSSGWWQKAAVM